MPETWLDADSRFNIPFIGLKQLLTSRTRTSFPPRRRFVVSHEHSTLPQNLRASNRPATGMRLQKKVCRVRVKTEPKHLTTGPEIRDSHTNWILQKQTRWMNAARARRSQRPVAPVQGLARWGQHVAFSRQQGGRRDTLVSRTRTGWPTAEAHGTLCDKERPLTLTAAVLHWLRHNSLCRVQKKKTACVWL